jgi:hypothetical protein
MSYKYEIIDGQRVEVHVARDFKAMRAEFFAVWGLVLYVSSGTRTRLEQTKLWNAWLAWSAFLAGRGPRVPFANLAAAPGYSNHEESGPRGPRALDLRDSGKDAGVTVIGSARSNWLAANAHRWGFTPAGHSFKPREGWHYEYTRRVGGVLEAIVAPVVAAVKRVTSAKPSVMLKWRWAGIASMLRRHYGYRGNDVPGPIMVRAFQRFLNAKGYARRAIGRSLRVDGRLGVNTAKAAQVWLASRGNGRYRGKIDGIPGKGTAAAWNVAERENAAAF